MITTDNLINTIYTTKSLFNLIERHIFFYGIDFSYRLVYKKLNDLDIKCSLRSVKEGLDYIFKIKYLIFIQELCHKALYKPNLVPRIKKLNESSISWDIVKDTQSLIKDTIITPYLLKDMSRFLNTGSI